MTITSFKIIIYEPWWGKSYWFSPGPYDWLLFFIVSFQFFLDLRSLCHLVFSFLFIFIQTIALLNFFNTTGPQFTKNKNRVNHCELILLQYLHITLISTTLILIVQNRVIFRIAQDLEGKIHTDVMFTSHPAASQFRYRYAILLFMFFHKVNVRKCKTTFVPVQHFGPHYKKNRQGTLISFHPEPM